MRCSVALFPNCEAMSTPIRGGWYVRNGGERGVGGWVKGGHRRPQGDFFWERGRAGNMERQSISLQPLTLLPSVTHPPTYIHLC